MRQKKIYQHHYIYLISGSISSATMVQRMQATNGEEVLASSRHDMRRKRSAPGRTPAATQWLS